MRNFRYLFSLPCVKGGGLPLCGKTEGLFTRNREVVQHRLTPFFLMRQAQEKALCGKRSAENISPSADGDQGSAFGYRNLLKKVDQNFPKLQAKLSLSFLPFLRQSFYPPIPRGMYRNRNTLEYLIRIEKRDYPHYRQIPDERRRKRERHNYSPRRNKI